MKSTFFSADNATPVFPSSPSPTKKAAIWNVLINSDLDLNYVKFKVQHSLIIVSGKSKFVFLVKEMFQIQYLLLDIK